jgi:hypothetical protein
MNPLRRREICKITIMLLPIIKEISFWGDPRYICHFPHSNKRFENSSIAIAQFRRVTVVCLFWIISPLNRSMLNTYCVLLVSAPREDSIALRHIACFYLLTVQTAPCWKCFRILLLFAAAKLLDASAGISGSQSARRSPQQCTARKNKSYSGWTVENFWVTVLDST